MSDLIEQIEKDIKNGETADKAHYFIRKAVINKIIDALREHDRMQIIADDNLKAAADKAGITYMGCDTPDALAERIAELESDLAGCIKLIAKYESERDEIH